MRSGTARPPACQPPSHKPEREPSVKTVTVLGAGSWGTALAIHLGRLEHDVRLWARDPGLAADLQARRANPVYLPDQVLPEARDSDGLHGRGAAGGRARGLGRALPRHARRDASGRSLARAWRGHRQHDQGPRGGHVAARVGNHRAGSRSRAPGRRVVGAELRGRSGAWPADRRSRRLHPRRGRRRWRSTSSAGRSSASTAATTWWAWRWAGR